MQQNRVAPDKHQLRNIACPSTHISHAQDTHNTSPQFSPVPYTTCHVLCMHLKRYQIPSNHYIFLPSERSVCMQSTALSLRLLSSFWYSVEPLWLGLFCLPVKEFYGTQYQSGLLFLNFMWGVIFTACVVFLFFSNNSHTELKTNLQLSKSKGLSLCWANVSPFRNWCRECCCLCCFSFLFFLSHAYAEIQNRARLWLSTFDDWACISFQGKLSLQCKQCRLLQQRGGCFTFRFACLTRQDSCHDFHH